MALFLQDRFVFLWVCCSPSTHGSQGRTAPLCASHPAHCWPLLQYKLGFMVWWQVFWNQTVSEKMIYLHKQCHPRRSTENTIKTHSSKPSWSPLFFPQLTPPKVTICMLKCLWKIPPLHSLCEQPSKIIQKYILVSHLVWIESTNRLCTYNDDNIVVLNKVGTSFIISWPEPPFLLSSELSKNAYSRQELSISGPRSTGDCSGWCTLPLP